MPAGVLMTVLGIPTQDWLGIGEWIGANLAGHDITKPAADKAMGATCYMAINAYLQALTSGNGPVPPTPGGLSLICSPGTRSEPDKLSTAQVQTSTGNLMIAGYLSTTFLIATGTTTCCAPTSWSCCGSSPRCS